jgi:hypothetical protein
MNDSTPNDFSHLSDAEFQSLCPQGEHAPGQEPLSPAAQTIVKAFDDRYELLGPLEDDWQEQCLAAALRAAIADQNKQIDVPFSRIDQWEKIKGSTLSYWTAAQWGYQKAMSEFLAIATELEDHQ